MPCPSQPALNAVIKLRHWARVQKHATGLAPDPETLARRVAAHYGSLSPGDRAYVLEHGDPHRVIGPGFMEVHG